MKRIMVATSVMIVAALLTCVSFSQARAEPTVTIELLNPPPEDLLILDVGETYTFDIEITSGEPFVLAMAMSNAYYPGRSIHWHGGDRETRVTYALLHLMITGNDSTADLPAVSGWPEPGDLWPEGVAPVSILAGMRYKGGVLIAEEFAFAVEVP
jgi:hypothetical protein